MSFSSDFTSCLSPLPPPQNVLDSVEELLDGLEQLHSAWENSGGDEEMTLAALLGVGALLGIDEAALAAAGTAAGITVLGYIAACAGCAASAAGSAIWDFITASNDSFIKDQLTVAANDRGIPQPDSSSSAVV